MSDTRERKGRFRRLVNRQRPRQLFNFLESKALQIRHWRRKSLGTSPTSAQDFAGKSPAVGQNICWTLNTKHDFTSLDDNEAHHKQKGNDRLLNPTATHQYSIENIYELIKLAGLIPVSIQDNIGAASPKDAPFLESELLFGAGFPRDNIFCYRARVPIQDNSCRGPDHEFRRDPTQQAGRLLCPEEEPLNRKQRHLACPFLLHDSITYEGRPGCRGAAFPNPSRLKCHKQKPHCTKCGEPFVDESSHADHKVCSTNFVHPVTGKFLREFKGFNKEQEAKLRDKKRKRGGSNEEKWKDIFNILFPDATEVPNPCKLRFHH
ncbi:zinc finger c2h2-type protein [Colletotrichum asianum]